MTDDDMARRLLTIFGDSLDRQIENIEYNRDRSTGLYRPEHHRMFLRARQLRDEARQEARNA